MTLAQIVDDKMGGHAPRRFLVVLFSLLALGLAAVAAINVIVDPYDVLRVVDTPWLPNRPAQVGHDRLFKAHLVRSERPDAILVGTSRAQVMLNPSSPSLASFGVEHAVNAAVNGAQPYDALRLFQHAHALRPQKLLVYGLDMLAFDAGGQVPDTLDEGRFAVDVQGHAQPLSAFVDVPAVVLSEDALRSSLSTLRKRHQPSYFTRLGQRDARYQEEDRARAGGPHEYFRASERDYLGNYACAHPFRIKGGPALSSTKPLEDFRKLLDAAREAKVAVRLYFSPVHARHLEVIAAAGLLDAQEEWKAAVRAIVDDERARGLDVVLLDFIGLAFDEAPGGPSWWESSHATAAVGEQVLAALLGPGNAAPPPQIREAFAAWELGHTEEVKEIQALAGKVLPEERSARGCGPSAPPSAAHM